MRTVNRGTQLCTCNRTHFRGSLSPCPADGLVRTESPREAALPMARFLNYSSLWYERPPEKRKVAGSIPALATTNLFFLHGCFHPWSARPSTSRRAAAVDSRPLDRLLECTEPLW